MNFPLETNDWKKIEKNNRIVAINVLYVKIRKNISFVCVSKHDSNCEKKVILLMTPNREE